MSLQSLKEMFPHLDSKVVEGAYNLFSGDFEKALAQLLSMASSSEPVKPILPKPISVIPRHDGYSATIDKVCNMTYDAEAKRIASLYGLNIMNVSWEDTARTKGSSWGPCISDMTLQVNNRSMPLIRYPNFTDLTCDVRLEKIPLVVGNEMGEKTRVVTLRDYFDDFRNYLSFPSRWPGSQKSLLAPRDSHAIVSTQACFLPIPAEGEAKFNVALYNYQSRPSDPAVLAIVATSQGTSAQVITSRGAQKLYFNRNGNKASFIGERLSFDRLKKGAPVSGPKTKEEELANMIMVIQVPLKQKPVSRKKHVFLESAVASYSAAPSMMMMDEKEEEDVDVEDAVIKVGSDEGPFPEIESLPITRDPNYPIRVTIQFYKATSNGLINSDVTHEIASQFEKVTTNADYIGSLVVGPSYRPTEHTKSPSTVIPPWWTPFWLTYKHNFPQYTEEQAKEKVFARGRFTKSTRDEAEGRIIDILSEGVIVDPVDVIEPFMYEPGEE